MKPIVTFKYSYPGLNSKFSAFVDEDSLPEFQALVKTEAFNERCLMFYAVLLMEKQEINSTLISDTAENLSNSDVFDESLIPSAGGANFKDAKIQLRKINNFWFSKGQKKIVQYFEKTVKDEETLYFLKINLEEMSITRFVKEIVQLSDAEKQLYMYQLLETNDFKDVLTRALLIEAIENNGRIFGDNLNDDGIK
jgi:hypothetical protein